MRHTKAESFFFMCPLCPPCAMFTNDHKEMHCIDERMNHSHFIYMSLHRFQGQIKDSGVSSETQVSWYSCKVYGLLMNPCKNSSLRLKNKERLCDRNVPLQYYFRAANIT